MALSVQEQMLIEQRVSNDAKSVGVSYLLWFFLGSLGAHRFYLGRTGTGVLILALTIVGILTSFIGVGLALLLVMGIWVLVDAFLIPGMVARNKESIRQRLTHEAMAYGSGTDASDRRGPAVTDVGNAGS